jgi:hypothetical protein
MSSITIHSLMAARLRYADTFHACMGLSMSVPASLYQSGFNVFIALPNGLAQGRSVSISRGSPPLQEE